MGKCNGSVIVKSFYRKCPKRKIRGPLYNPLYEMSIQRTYGGKRKYPWIERMAERGVDFTKYYDFGGWPALRAEYPTKREIKRESERERKLRIYLQAS